MNNITSFKETIDTMNSELAALRKNYQERSQSILKEMFKLFFDENPEVKVVGWRQMTPYFNDGEECVFNTYVEYAFVSNTLDYTNIEYGEYCGDEENVWVEDPVYGSFAKESIPESIRANAKILRDVLQSIDKSAYLDAFGDHCVVCVTRDGFDIRDYNHD
ncbi:MAG: hypothetical protein ACYDG4_17935 [Desulfuromonadaceae bacterium]